MSAAGGTWATSLTVPRSDESTWWEIIGNVLTTPARTVMQLAFVGTGCPGRAGLAVEISFLYYHSPALGIPQTQLDSRPAILHRKSITFKLTLVLRRCNRAQPIQVGSRLSGIYKIFGISWRPNRSFSTDQSKTNFFDWPSQQSCFRYLSTTTHCPSMSGTSVLVVWEMMPWCHAEI